jgi:hypothetical protein
LAAKGVAGLPAGDAFCFVEGRDLRGFVMSFLGES